VTFTIWIILNNLSLALNPLGFYQIAKILTTPTVVVLNYFIAGTTVSKIVVGALGAICIGVAMTRQGSTETTLLGVFVATAAFITTPIYQTWIGTKQERVNSAQLLFNQSYLSLGMLTIIMLIPFTDRQQLAQLRSERTTAKTGCEGLGCNWAFGCHGDGGEFDTVSDYWEDFGGYGKCLTSRVLVMDVADE
jgi:hypothetical protein